MRLIDYYPYHKQTEQQSIVVGYVLKFGDKYAQQIKQELQTDKMHLTIALTTKQSKALVIRDLEIAKSYAKIFYGKLGTVKIGDKL